MSQKIQQLREHFVPEEGISRRVLDDKLPAFFGRNARIERRLQLPNGEIGWFVAGGRVTKAIIEDLRKATQRLEQREEADARTQRALVPETNTSFQYTSPPIVSRAPTSNFGRSSDTSVDRHGVDRGDSSGRAVPVAEHAQRTVDRHLARNANSSTNFPPQRSSSFFPPDSGPAFNPSKPERHPPTDAVDSSTQESAQSRSGSYINQISPSNLPDRHRRPPTSNTDPADAAKNLGHDFTIEDFEGFKKFQDYLALRKAYQQQQQQQQLDRTAGNSQGRSKLYNDEANVIGSPPPPYQPEDIDNRARRHEASESSRGRDDEDDDDPPYGQNQPTYGTRHGSDRRVDIGRPSGGVRLIVCPRDRCSRVGNNGFTRNEHLMEHLRLDHGIPIASRRDVSPKKSKGTSYRHDFEEDDPAGPAPYGTPSRSVRGRDDIEEDDQPRSRRHRSRGRDDEDDEPPYGQKQPTYESMDIDEPEERPRRRRESPSDRDRTTATRRPGDQKPSKKPPKGRR